MQSAAPSLLDISGETESTLAMYGIDGSPTDNYGRQCLIARRMSEAGVRFVQVSHAYWDQHSELKEKHQELATEVDKPIAGLLMDLKQRGMLEETLVIWGGEFGRTPTAQGNNGRDHNPHAFTWWMAGGGVKAGFSYGESDEFGFYAAHNKVHVHDLHATILHLLGIDHERLTYPYGGRDFRLTDVEGNVIHEIMA
jgi:membrane-anchored protein YejM (alkaline phosphatase superfamily)